jgi:hypothetical protein
VERVSVTGNGTESSAATEKKQRGKEVRRNGCLEKIEGAGTFRFLRPLLDCAAKFLTLPGSIWPHSKASSEG